MLTDTDKLQRMQTLKYWNLEMKFLTDVKKSKIHCITLKEQKVNIPDNAKVFKMCNFAKSISKRTNCQEKKHTEQICSLQKTFHLVVTQSPNDTYYK